jgi:hypothetical protein
VVVAPCLPRSIYRPQWIHFWRGVEIWERGWGGWRIGTGSRRKGTKGEQKEKDRTRREGDISKFNPIFASLTWDDPKFASLLKFNPGACKHFDLGVFSIYFVISWFSILFSISNPTELTLIPLTLSPYLFGLDWIEPVKFSTGTDTSSSFPTGASHAVHRPAFAAAPPKLPSTATARPPASALLPPSPPQAAHVTGLLDAGLQWFGGG